MSERLASAIQDRTARVAILGLGYVGLPLAVALAEQGFPVVGIDPATRRVAEVRDGISHTPDVESGRIKAVLAAGKLSLSTDYTPIAECQVAVICVPTPLRKTRDPDISLVLEAVRGIRSLLHPDLLIILESTTYPGTTEELLVPELSGPELALGEQLFVAMSPERLDPGNPSYGIHNTPKIVGGVTPICTQLAMALYQTVVEQVVPVSSPKVAEMVKLHENTFRAVNIGLANELAIMCQRLGIDTWEVVKGASSKPFGFMPFYPGPGLGGHCIPVDPLYLSWKLKTLNYTARFIELASEVNSRMPEFVVQRAMEALNRVRKCLNGSRILVLGVAYKRDVGDIRESPAIDIMRLLQGADAVVDFHDDLVPRLSLTPGETLGSLPQPVLEEGLSRYDLVVIATDHSHVDYGWVVKEAALILDCRNATQGVEAEHVIRL